MQKNKKGFSIIIGMGLTLLILLMSYYLLSYIIPFSKNVKGIEQSSSAYYNAYAGIEETLLKVKSRPNLTTEFSKSMVSTSQTGISYRTTSSGGSFPVLGKGNSEYDKNYDIISPSNPIQLEVGGNQLGGGRDTAWWGQFELKFKVPNIRSGTTLELKSQTGGIIQWVLSSGTNSLFGNSGSNINSTSIKKSDYVINLSNPWLDSIQISSYIGTDLNGNNINVKDYRDNNCKLASSGCVLKLSIINKLETTTNIILPYLEYYMNPGGTYISKFPLYNTTINTSGKSYGFQKSLEVQVPQQTTNQAFDFTIFQ